MTKLECDLQLTDLMSDTNLARAVEAKMRDPQFSSGGMLCPTSYLLEEMKQSEEELELGFQPEQLGEKVMLLARLAMQEGSRPSDIARDIACMLLGQPLPQVRIGPSPLSVWKQTDSVEIPTRPEWCKGGTWKYSIPGKYDITVTIFMGSQECPFKKEGDTAYHGFEYGDRDYLIRNLKTNETILISDLALHMAITHGYWEKSPNKHYDLSLRKAARVLEIQPSDLKRSFHPITNKQQQYVSGWYGDLEIKVDASCCIFESDKLRVYDLNGELIFEPLQPISEYKGIQFEGRPGWQYKRMKVRDSEFLDVPACLALLE